MDDKKRKRTATSVAWRIDQDYWNKLSPEEREWLRKFNDNYYRAEFRHKDNVLPDEPEKRREAYNAKNAARRDIVTQSEENVLEARKPSKSRFKGNPYGPDDYVKSPSSRVEDELIGYLDDKYNYRFTN